MTHHATPPRGRPAAPPPDDSPVDLRLLAAGAVTQLCRSQHTIHCGLTITRTGRVPETIAASSDVPVRVDWLQHELREGPDLTPLSSDLIVCRDLAADERWPDFGRMCTSVLGVRTMVSVHAHAPDLVVTLKFLSDEPTAFDHLDVDAALRLARRALPVARTALDHLTAGSHAPRAQCSTMALALAIVTARFRLGPADGFALLARAAARGRRHLHEVAADVVREGQLPSEPNESRHTGEGAGPTAPGHPGAPFREVGGPDLWRDAPGPGRAPSSTRSASFGGPGPRGSRCWTRVDTAGAA